MGGFENILMITDHFYLAVIHRLFQLEIKQLKVLFKNPIVHYRFPAKLHSDQGADFESTVI